MSCGPRKVLTHPKRNVCVSSTCCQSKSSFQVTQPQDDFCRLTPTISAVQALFKLFEGFKINNLVKYKRSDLQSSSCSGGIRMPFNMYDASLIKDIRFTSSQGIVILKLCDSNCTSSAITVVSGDATLLSTNVVLSVTMNNNTNITSIAVLGSPLPFSVFFSG